MNVVKDFFKFKKYNVHEITNNPKDYSRQRSEQQDVNYRIPEEELESRSRENEDDCWENYIWNRKLCLEEMEYIKYCWEGSIYEKDNDKENSYAAYSFVCSSGIKFTLSCSYSTNTQTWNTSTLEVTSATMKRTNNVNKHARIDTQALQ